MSKTMGPGWAKELVAGLFDPEDRQHIQQVESYIAQNNQFLGQAHAGFSYMGFRYGPGGGYTKDAPPLAQELMQGFGKHMTYMNRVRLDRSIIQQTLVKLLGPCDTEQQIRDALPECLVAASATLRSYPRTAEVAWTLRDDPRALAQFNKVLPKIEMYCATRFIY